MRRLTGHLVLAALAAAAIVSRAQAAAVSAQLASRETYVGVPVILRVTVEDGQPDQLPVTPAISGATIRMVGGPSHSSQTTVVNGQVSQSVSVSYTYQITPQKPGRIMIPPFEVQVGGEKLASEPQVIVVARSETNDLLFVDVTGTRDSVYVGELLEVTLQIWLRPYHSREHGITLREDNMWGLVDVEASQWGVFEEPLKQMYSRRQRPPGEQMLRKDSQGNEHEYYLYELTREIWAERPGMLDVGGVNVVVKYPTGIGRSQSIFDMNRLVLTGTRPLSAQPQTVPVQVKAIPTEGRPDLFRGAVGEYAITATAKPEEVTVGDPITLTLAISGTGRLDLLQPPPLSDVPDLIRSFKVPTDPLAGEVEGNTKRFSQSIRAVSDAVREIPSIPFVYFDPRAERFVTIATRPIPIAVKPADRLSSGQVVDAATNRAVARTLTEVAGGILANYTSEDELLAHQDVRPGWGLALLLLVPPIVFGVCWIVQSRRSRFRTDVAYARRRTARRMARSRVQHPGRQNTAAAVLAAIGGYVADRCNLPPGTLTRAEIIRYLSDRGVKRSLREEMDRLLVACEQAQYAGTAGSDAKEFAAAALRCVDLLERERF